MSTTAVPAPRVLHVTTVHQPFDSRIFQKEARGLANSGYSVRLATTVDSASHRDGVLLLPLGSAKGGRWRRLLRDFRALLTMLAHRDEIIHIHDPELLLVAALPATLGARVIYDVHELYHDRIPSREWLPRGLRKPAAMAYEAVERLVIPRCAGIVVVLEALAPYYERFLPKERVAVVRNYPNISPDEIAAARASAHPLQHRPYVIHTGGASKQVAFHAIVDAAERLRERQSDLAFVNVGEIDMSEYSQDVRVSLMSRARRAGIVQLGRIDHREILVWLAHARLGYLPLIDTENHRRALPNKLFEYLLFGLPTVASDIGRVSDILRQSGSGVLLELENGRSHGDALVDLHEDSNRFEALAAAARTASNAFSFHGELARLHALYDRVATD